MGIEENPETRPRKTTKEKGSILGAFFFLNMDLSFLFLFITDCKFFLANFLAFFPSFPIFYPFSRYPLSKPELQKFSSKFMGKR